MQVEDVCSLVTRVVRDASGDAPEIAPDTPLLLSGLLDSLTIMRIVSEIEADAGVALPESAIVARTFRTPSSIHDAVVVARGAAREALG
jgi:acyl carrier protein